MAADIATLGLRVDANGYIRTMDSVDKTNKKVEKSGGEVEKMMRRLAAALSLVGISLSAQKLIDYADAWTLIEARIGLVTRTSRESKIVQYELFQVAQRARVSFEPTAELYTKIARNAKALNASQADMIRVTESVTKGFVISGAGADETASSVRQLGQAFASGALRGDELNTVLENAPRLAQAIADGMGVSIGQLRKMGAEGKLTSQQVFKAILSQSGSIETEFKKMPTTIGQAFTILDNELFRMVGLGNDTADVSKNMAKFIIGLANNLVTLAAGIGAVVNGLIAYAIATKAAAAYTAVLAAVETIAAFISLAKAVRSVADAMALMQLMGKGALGIVAAIAAMTLGFLAYKKLLSDIMAEQEKWANKLDELKDKPLGGNGAHVLTDKEKQQLLENAAMLRQARQAIELARLEGMAQEALAIQYDAVNKVIELRSKELGAQVMAQSIAAVWTERDLKLQELQVRSAREGAVARELMRTESEQAIALAGKYGNAETALRIEYEATNKAVEARRTLTGQVLADMLRAIDAEKANRLIAEQIRVLQAFRDTVRQTFAGVFETIFNDGIKNFADLFGRVKQMFNRMLADLVAKRFMEVIGDHIAGTLAGLFGGMDAFKPKDTPLTGAATALTGSATALNSSAIALTNAATALHAPPPVPAGARGPQPVTLENVTVSAKRSLLTDMAKYIGPVIAGFMVGNSVGGMTSNRALGTLGGAASGALTGAAIGSVVPGVGTAVGAIVGGVAGAIGGFFGSNSKRKAEQKARNDLLAQNNARLLQLSEGLAGDIMRGSNLAKAIQATLYTGKSASELARSATASGLSLAQLEMIAHQVGITLYDSAGKLIPGALAQLNAALKLTAEAATHFGNSMSELQLRQEARDKLFDVPDTQQHRLENTYERLTTLAPDLMRQMGLSNLNLATEAGRSVLLNGLRDIFKLIDSGQLTPELLGAFTDKGQLLEAILAIKEALGSTTSALDSVNDGFGILGDELTNVPPLFDLVLRRIRASRVGDDPTSPTPPATPPPPSSGGGPTETPAESGVGRSGGGTGRHQPVQNFNVTFEAGSIRGTNATEIADEVATAVTEIIATRLRRTGDPDATELSTTLRLTAR